MKALFALLLALCVLPAKSETIAWTNGFWFDGQRFAAGTFFTVDGLLTTKKPDAIAQTVDLGGKYVVPAFGDAHHHGIDGENGLEDKAAAFLKAGVFYVKNPNVIPDLLTPAVRARLNKPGSIDVSFSNGGLTSSGGHPVRLHEILSSRGVFPGLGPQDMENRAYFIIDSEADLASKWPRILAGTPDFIKTFLSFSKGSQQIRDKPSGWKGLDPGILSAVVRRAHAANLRVSTHVDTASDFRNAVEAGVDEINHLPLPHPGAVGTDLSAYVIDPVTAKKAASRRITVVPTALLLGKRIANPLIRTNVSKNLRTLQDAGVPIAIGSDGISGETPFVTGLDEVMFLHELGFCDNLTLLKMWSENTPRTIFPNRKIGALREHYEANFLVLEGNPLIDFAQIKRIAMRVKAGRLL